jgi:hypothetical protein
MTQAVKAVLALAVLLGVYDLLSLSESNGVALHALEAQHSAVLAQRDAAIGLLGRHQLQSAMQAANSAPDADACDRAALHRVFCRFPLWRGRADAAPMAVSMHGVVTRVSFFPSHLRASVDGVASLPDARSAATFVHASLLMAVASATGHGGDGDGVAVSVADIGAAWGQWLSTAHHAAKQLFGERARVSLLGVEAEPTHFDFMQQHLIDNGIDARQHRLVRRVVHAGSPHTPTLRFYVGRADEWYGQCIADDDRRGEKQAELDAVTISELLRGTDAFDWLQIDVGGYRGAFELVRGGGDELLRRVRWLVVRTVDPHEHAAVRELLAADWWLTSDYVGRSEPHETPWGATVFDNGLLVAVNPRRAEKNQFLQ